MITFPPILITFNSNTACAAAAAFTDSFAVYPARLHNRNRCSLTKLKKRISNVTAALNSAGDQAGQAFPSSTKVASGRDESAEAKKKGLIKIARKNPAVLFGPRIAELSSTFIKAFNSEWKKLTATHLK